MEAETKKCPFCAETIKAEAIVCRYCGRDLAKMVEPDAESPKAETETKKDVSPAVSAALISLLLTALYFATSQSNYGYTPNTFNIVTTFVTWWVISLAGLYLWKKYGFLSGCAILIVALGALWWLSDLMLSGTGTIFSPTPTATLWPRPTSEPSRNTNCNHVSEIGTSMEGRVICVYGIVSTIEDNPGAFQIRFLSRFFLASGKYVYDEVKAGDCVYAEGKVLLSSERVPYINIDDALYKCEPWMEGQ